MSANESNNRTSTRVFQLNTSTKTPFRDAHSSLAHKDYGEERFFAKRNILEQKSKEENDLSLEDYTSDSEDEQQELVPRRRQLSEFDKVLAEINNDLDDPVVQKPQNAKLSNRAAINGESSTSGLERSTDEPKRAFQEENRNKTTVQPLESLGYVQMKMPLPRKASPCKAAYAYESDSDSDDEDDDGAFGEMLRWREQQKEMYQRKAKEYEEEQNKKEKVTFTKVIPISITENVFENSNFATRKENVSGHKKRGKTTKTAKSSNNVVQMRVHPIGQNGGGAFRRFRNGVARVGRFIRKQISKLSCTAANQI